MYTKWPHVWELIYSHWVFICWPGNFGSRPPIFYIKSTLSFHLARMLAKDKTNQPRQLRQLLGFEKENEFQHFFQLFAMTVGSTLLQKRHFSHYENMPIQIHWKFYHQKIKKNQIKNSDIFHISAQNIDCRYSLEPPWWGSSNEYPQSMLLSRNKKNNAYPCKSQFYYIKVGFKGVKIILTCFRDATKNCWHFSYYSMKTYTVEPQ